MPVLSSGPYPRVSLQGLADGPRFGDVWTAGGTLIVHGHRDCKTTRQTLPFVDRIHRRKGRGTTVLAVLQDDAETARTLVSGQGLVLPVYLEADPYPLAAALSLEVVPTLFLLDREGRIEKAVEGFKRAELEAFAASLGVEGPLFVPEDNAPATKPG